MTYEGLSRISVCVIDEGGLLQVRGGEGQYSGVLPRVPSALSIGDTAHVRLSLPKGANDDETVDLLGTILLLEGGPGPVALKDGLIFEVSVSHMTRSAIADASASSPAALEVAASEAAAVADPGLAVESLEDASLDDQEIVADEDVQSVESPIHFGLTARAVDVERREADPALEAELLGAAPLPSSGSASDEDANDDEELDEEKLKAAALERSKAQQLLAAAAEAAAAEAAAAARPARINDELEEDVEDEAGLAAATLADEDVDASLEDDDGFSHEEITAHERKRRRGARAVFEATEPSGIVGTLREMALTEVVQSLGFSGKTAEIEVRPKSTDVASGVVFLESGNVVYARCGALLGERAFFALSQQRRGAFLIRFHLKPPSRNINRPTAFLLLEALRLMDEENHERDLVEAVAEEQAATDAARADDEGEEEALDRTIQSASPEVPLENASLANEEPGVTEPFARIPSRAVEAPRQELEYELDDADVEEALIAIDDLRGAGREVQDSGRPYATAMPTTVFSRFFEEASEEEELIPEVGAGESEEMSDPTFSGLKAALKGLKRSDEDTLAAFDRPVSSGSYPSYS